ncbi:DNA polymerase zeta [Savitreella phatthalungensis]
MPERIEFSLNYIDYELFPPTALDQSFFGASSTDGVFEAVPIIRLFGRTDAGQNVCALVHGIFPYMFVEYKAGSLDRKTVEGVQQRVCRAINACLATAFRKNPHDDNNQYVASVRLCRAVPFYGLHAGWRPYLKISLLSPRHMTRLADLFRQGTITGEPTQPFESQLPYLLQFMIDYNLFGCGTVSCAKALFRQPLPSRHEAPLTGSWTDSAGVTVKILHEGNVADDSILDEKFPRTTHAALEFDVEAIDIENRRALTEKAIHGDIVTEGRKTGVVDDRILTSLTELWREDHARRQALGLAPSQSQQMRSGQRARHTRWNNEDATNEQLRKVLESKQRQVEEQSADVLLGELRTTFQDVALSCSEQHESIRGQVDDISDEPQTRTFQYGNLVPQLSQTQARLVRQPGRLVHEYRQSTISVFLSKSDRLRGGGNHRDLPAPPMQASLGRPTQQIAFPEPFFSRLADVPALSRQYGMLEKRPISSHAKHRQPFLPDTALKAVYSRWRYLPKAPVARAAEGSASKSRITHTVTLPTQVKEASQLSRISQSDIPLSTLSLEIHAVAKTDMLPNPVDDPVVAVFWCFKDFGLGIEARSGTLFSRQELTGFQKVTDGYYAVDTELDLFMAVVELVRTFDPDIVVSYEIQNASVGYIHERAKLVYQLDFCEELGRALSIERDRPVFHDRWGETHATSVKIQGRHVLNLWRTMRSELNLLQYTLENVCFHLLKLRIPKYSADTLHRWLTSRQIALQVRALEYYQQRTLLNLTIIEQQGILSRVSEQARLLGIDFYSVFSRGSQFKVESLMFRIAKPECYMMMAPSRKQVAQQNALECLPLVMEPISGFYNNPVVVLDFQSLYPSIMIAYNLCYSTCLGKLGYEGLESKLGVTHYSADPVTMVELQNHIDVSPNGVLFVKESRRRSVLAKMLRDLLETRAMIKDGAKLYPGDARMQKVMHNRQLALKLIANVTYGYTSASFSGRMPCADIADAIVQTGRETLEAAIELIHAHPTWAARVVYGDTDSLFIELRDRTKAAAFDIGRQIADAITGMNPSPVKLKFEKVYLPCILLAKKRYVGFKYEKLDDKFPSFDAKGIETVRRDGTPAEQKIEENALKLLFRTGDLSQVKDYFQRECSSILSGKISLHDFCFAKEVKLGSYSTKGVPPPGAVISAKSIARDPRSEPQYGERIPYVVTSGSSRSRLVDRCVAPEELLLNPDLRLDVEYYIGKNLIPPLDRIFALMGVNVRSWYDDMPRATRLNIVAVPQAHQQVQQVTKTTHLIEDFLGSSHCPVCRTEQSRPGVCNICLARPAETTFALQMQATARELAHQTILRVCWSCVNVSPFNEVACVSKDCALYYRRVELGRQVHINLVHDLLGDHIDMTS